MRHRDEVEFSKYDFQVADVELATRHARTLRGARRGAASTPALVLPAYEATLKCSHLFNLLDARGAVSVTERVGLIRRVRDLACACARAYVAAKEGQRPRRSEPEPAAVAGD